ncbi:hypothetical protein N7507_000081 [Penicillium longicatenatum]|nr:hypothetical protein N7507_000081 [Penicillium longicatenatum]
MIQMLSLAIKVTLDFGAIPPVWRVFNTQSLKSKCKADNVWSLSLSHLMVFATKLLIPHIVEGYYHGYITGFVMSAQLSGSRLKGLQSLVDFKALMLASSLKPSSNSRLICIHKYETQLNCRVNKFDAETMATRDITGHFEDNISRFETFIASQNAHGKTESFSSIALTGEGLRPQKA